MIASPLGSQTICEHPEGVSNLVVYWFSFSNWRYFYDFKGRGFCTLANTYCYVKASKNI